MAMVQMTCASCRRLFTIRAQSPAQTFCPDPECQRERRRLWNRKKLQTDLDYRANQQAAQQAWHARNPDYWRDYRQRQKGSDGGEHVVTRPATNNASSCGVNVDRGLFWIEIQSFGKNGKPTIWRIELKLKLLTHRRK